jgi:hypothetical protein
MYLSSHPGGQLDFTSFPYQAGLFSAVITAFIVPKIQDLKVDPADQSAYYLQQSVQILAQISQQLASNHTQILSNLTHPSPYPTFHSSSSDRLVAVFWLMSLVFSLCAALAATLVQQWARAHLRPFQRQASLLKTLWIQIVLSEGVGRLQVVAGVVPRLIHLSLIFFFLGLIHAIMVINPFVALVTIALIFICSFYYIYGVTASITNPRWPYQNWLSNGMSRLIRNPRLILHNIMARGRVIWPGSLGAPATEPTTKSRPQDVRELRWMLDRINRSNKVETLVLAIPATFDQEWSRNVWKALVGEAQSTAPADVQVNSSPNIPRPREDPVINFCARVRQMFETYNNEKDSPNETARKQMQGCVETVACLVFCADIPSNWFGDIREVGEVLSEVGHYERVNKPLTIRSNPRFAARWTCLSLAAIRQMVMAPGNRVRELAGFAVSGIARFHDYGAPDIAALKGAERIDGYMKTAWEHVEYLHHQAFEPRGMSRTEEEIKSILESCASQITELERIENEANGIDVIDWRISLLQDAMNGATAKLTRRLPGVLFDQLQQSQLIPIREAFDFPLFGSTPITPLFIFPQQQLQGLFALGRGLRNILEGNILDGRNKDIFESLASIGNIPMPLRRLNHLMKRQLSRLQDLRDGGGLGFTIELFFLALRQLSLASVSLTLESKEILYSGTFEAITSGWVDSKHSFGTQAILLDLVCDLVIQGRGVFSDIAYPTYIVNELLELVRKMVVDGHGGLQTHIKDAVQDAVQELQAFNPGEDQVLPDKALLRDRVLEAITPSPSQNTPPDDHDDQILASPT